MISVKFNHHLNLEKYLKIAGHTDIKHEYIDGNIYPRAGASKAHNISVNCKL